MDSYAKDIVDFLALRGGFTIGTDLFLNWMPAVAPADGVIYTSVYDYGSSEDPQPRYGIEYPVAHIRCQGKSSTDVYRKIKFVCNVFDNTAQTIGENRYLGHWVMNIPTLIGVSENTLLTTYGCRIKAIRAIDFSVNYVIESVDIGTATGAISAIRSHDATIIISASLSADITTA